MKGKKYLSAFMITTLLGLTVFPTNIDARWHRHYMPIHPGDHVFDAKRYS